MAEQISFESAVIRQQAAGNVCLNSEKRPVRCLWPIIAVVAILTNLSNLNAESLASKNKKGNDLFAQGKYEDAERAYLDAQVSSPGRPEILYNLGNSLIKQKKYNDGIQALHQSMKKGNDGIKENSWFNEGNALFLMGNYKDSIQAFIQALRLDPADRDAKHNLELALMKLKEQKQAKSQQGQDQKDSEKQGSKQLKDGKQGSSQAQNKGSGGSHKPDESARSEGSQRAQSRQQRDSISKDQALRILEALQSRELEEQRRLQENRAQRRAAGKDW